MCVLTSDSRVQLVKATLHSGPCPDTRERKGSGSNEKHCKDELLGYGSMAQRLSGMCEPWVPSQEARREGKRLMAGGKGPFAGSNFLAFSPLRT